MQFWSVIMHKYIIKQAKYATIHMKYAIFEHEYIHENSEYTGK